MKFNTFKKFFCLSFSISVLFVIIIGVGLLFATKSKDAIPSFALLLILCLVANILSALIASYFAAMKKVIYHVKDESEAVNIITQTLNKAGYLNVEKNNEKLVFITNSRIEKYYGKVNIKICDKSIEVNAPYILFVKYLNRVRMQ